MADLETEVVWVVIPVQMKKKLNGEILLSPANVMNLSPKEYAQVFMYAESGRENKATDGILREAQLNFKMD